MLSSDNFIYKSYSLPCVGVEKQDSVTIGLQKMEETICELTSQIIQVQQEIYKAFPSFSTTTTTTTTSIH